MKINIPTSNVNEYIRALAEHNGVVYSKTSGDELAEIITRLADDDVKMDETEQLLIALERAGILPHKSVLPIHINYLREKYNVRPLQ